MLAYRSPGVWGPLVGPFGQQVHVRTGRARRAPRSDGMRAMAARLQRRCACTTARRAVTTTVGPTTTSTSTSTSAPAVDDRTCARDRRRLPADDTALEPSDRRRRRSLDRLLGVGSSNQVIASALGRLRLDDGHVHRLRSASTAWRQVFGPWGAHRRERLRAAGRETPRATAVRRRERTGSTSSSAWSPIPACVSRTDRSRATRSSGTTIPRAAPTSGSTGADGAGVDPEPMYNTPVLGARVIATTLRGPLKRGARSSCTSRPDDRRRDVCHCRLRRCWRCCPGSIRRNNRAS